LEEIATTLTLALGEKISVQVARERLIENLCKDYPFEKYLAFVGYMGEKADLIFADKTVTATLLSVDGEGGLWVDIDGEKRRVASGEVSLRTRGAV
jgi:hypothetical protein